MLIIIGCTSGNKVFRGFKNSIQKLKRKNNQYKPNDFFIGDSRQNIYHPRPPFDLSRNTYIYPPQIYIPNN